MLKFVICTIQPIDIKPIYHTILSKLSTTFYCPTPTPLPSGSSHFAMADDYHAQLLAVEAKLAKDPGNEELLTLKSDLMEIIELSGSLEEDEEQERQLKKSQQQTTSKRQQHMTTSSQPSSSGSNYTKDKFRKSVTDDHSQSSNQKCLSQVDNSDLVASVDGDSTARSDTEQHQRRPLSEAELLAKRKEKNRKKKAKLREKIKEQLDTAESVKQSWQSFSNQRGLKGLNKRSIFASPCSLTGKVGVGTNGIADAPPPKGGRSAASSAPVSKRRY